MAALLGAPLAISVAAIGAVAGLAAGWRWRLADSEKQDLRPWRVSVPRLLLAPREAEGPVMVQIEYCVEPSRAEDFRRAMVEVRRMRERDGAFGWLLARDPSESERHVESFMAESWLSYLRQLDHMTRDDHAIEDHARSFHQGSAPPAVIPLIGEHPNWHAGTKSAE
jgi:hypothetical protein